MIHNLFSRHSLIWPLPTFAFGCALTLSLLGHLSQEALAAKKYYPPGYKPPNANAEPTPPVQPQVIVSPPQQPAQTLIKTIVVPAKARPKDPLTALIENHRYFEAVRLINTRLKRNPGNLSLRLLKAQLLREEGNYEESTQEYQDILSKTKSPFFQAKAWQGLAMTLFYKGERFDLSGSPSEAKKTFTEAESAFKRSLSLSPRLSESVLGLAQLYLYEKRLNDGETYLKKAAQIAPNSALYHLIKGQYLYQQGKYSEALSHGYTARKLSQNNAQVYLLLGNSTLNLGKVDDAIIHFKQGLELDPDNTEMLRRLSNAYEQKMKPEDAESTLQKAISINPFDQAAVQSLLHFYDQNNAREKSVILLRSLTAQAPISNSKPLSEQAIAIDYHLQLLKRYQAHNDMHAVTTLAEHIIDRLNDEQIMVPGSPMRDIFRIYSQTLYQQGRGLVHRNDTLQDSRVQRLLTLGKARLNQHPDEIDLRLNLLFLDPLATLPPMPDAQNIPKTHWSDAVLIAFITGNQEMHRHYLSLYQEALSENSDSLYQNTKLWLDLGDCDAAQNLISQQLQLQPGSSEAQTLLKQAQEKRQLTHEQIRALEMLPKRFPLRYWEKTAQEAVRYCRGDWRLHEIFADYFMREKQYASAWFHQAMAAQYAPTDRKQQAFLKKASRTQDLLNRAQKQNP